MFSSPILKTEKKCSLLLFLFSLNFLFYRYVFCDPNKWAKDMKIIMTILNFRQLQSSFKDRKDHLQK